MTVPLRSPDRLLVLTRTMWTAQLSRRYSTALQLLLEWPG